MSTNEHQSDRYELVQRLISSSPGERWKAFDTIQRRYVILSLLPLYTQANSTLYIRKMSVLQSLRHPHIAPILGIEALPQQKKIINVTEYIDGPTLADALQAIASSGKRLALADLPGVLAPIASAIDYTHQHSIIHNALSPTNILLDLHNPLNSLPGTPSLLGFCTCYLYTPQRLPKETIPYISPELIQGQMDNQRNDLYSLGVILYELCTGTLPFQGDTADEIMKQHMHSTPISPTLINPSLPPSLTAVIIRSLSRDPLTRFQTGASLVTAITRALNVSAQGLLDQVSSPGSTPWLGLHSSPTHLSGPQLPLVAQVIVPTIAAAALPPGATPLPPSHTTMQAPATRRTTPHTAIPTAPMQQQPIGQPTRRRLYMMVVLPLLVILLGASLGGYFLLRNTFVAAPTISGHAFFANSGQLNLNTDAGIADQLRINLDGLPDPPINKSYYFWLLSDNSADKLPIAVGQSTHGGHIDLTYDKNTDHENLLASYSRLLVTFENTDPPPSNPTTDPGSWRYYAEFSTKKEGQYSQIDHLRHLLAKDPKLQQLPTPLNGGLDIWLFRNTLKVLEFAGSARDAQASGDVGLVQRQLVRIMDYLDSAQYVQTEKLPANIPYLLIDPVIAQVAILEIDEQQQSPPGYLKHISNHLGEMSQLTTATPEQRKLAVQINTAINNVQSWMLQIHADAEQLLQMSFDQLHTTAAQNKLNDIFTLANYAFTGHFDPNTKQIQEGVSQIHYNDLRLATFDVRACSSSTAANPCT